MSRPSYACCIPRSSFSNNMQNNFKILKSSPVQFCQLHIASFFIGRNYIHSTSHENIHKLCCFNSATGKGEQNRHKCNFSYFSRP
jgi:hypothetical protein